MSLAQSIFLDRVPFTLSYDYIIYTDGTYVYAFNNKTKAIEKTGTPEDVFNYVSSILNQNSGSVFVSGKRPDGQRAVYTFNTQGIYINTHKKVEWISDGAVLQHNITQPLSASQRDILIWIDTGVGDANYNTYPDTRVRIKGFVFQDIRTSLPSNPMNFPDPEMVNSFIAVGWGIDETNYQGRWIEIEECMFDDLKWGYNDIWCSPGAQYITLRNCVFKGTSFLVHFDYGDYINVLDNYFINLSNYGSAEVLLWGSDTPLPFYSNTHGKHIVRGNKFINTDLRITNDRNDIVSENIFIINMPILAGKAHFPLIYFERTVPTSNDDNYHWTIIENNIAYLYNNTYECPDCGNNTTAIPWLRLEGSGYIVKNNIIIGSGDANSAMRLYMPTDGIKNIIIEGNILWHQFGIEMLAKDSSGNPLPIKNVKIINNITTMINIAGSPEDLVIENNTLNGAITIGNTYSFGTPPPNNQVWENVLIRHNWFNPNVTNKIIVNSSAISSLTNVKIIDNVNYNPQPVSSITVGASPFVYQNTDFYPEDIIISGGSVSNIEWSRDGTNYYSLGITAGKVRLEVGEYLRVTYTTAPTMTKVPL